jgi:TP901 family phage tail tape measure protein
VAKEYPISIVIRAIDKATATMRKVESQFDKIGKGAAKLGKSLTTNVSLPVAAMGAASVAAFAKFESGMSNVSTLIDTNAESMEAMSKATLAIGQRVSVPLEDLSRALYDVRSAGVSAADSMHVLEQGARLGKAGLGTTAQSVDIATSALNAFQLKGEDAENVYNTIFKTVKAGKTNIAELSQSFGGVAGTVAKTGTQFDEFMASVGALTTTGLPASQAMRQVQATIAGLTRDTAQSRKVFKALGAKDLPDLIAKSRGLVPALSRISDKLGGNTAKMLNLVGSTEALNAVIGLTGAQNKAYTASLAELRNRVNAVDEAFEKQNSTLSAQAQLTKNAMTSVGVSIGAILAPALSDIATKLQEATAWFQGLDKGTQETIVQIGLAVAAVGPAIAIVGKLASGISVLVKAIRLVGVVIKVVSLAMAANPILLIIAAIAVAALLIYKYWEPIKAFFVKLWEKIREPFMRFMGWVWDIFLNLSPIGLIIKHWEPIKSFFSALWDGIVSYFEWVWDRIKAIAQGIADVVGTVIDSARSVGDAVDSVGSGVASFFGAGGEEEPGTSQATGGALFGRPGLAQLAAAGTASSTEASVKVEFANMPAGARATTDRRSTADVDLSVGYQMVPS